MAPLRDAVVGIGGCRRRRPAGLGALRRWQRALPGEPVHEVCWNSHGIQSRCSSNAFGCRPSTRCGWNKYVAVLRWSSYYRRHEHGARVEGGEHGGRKYASAGNSAQAYSAIGCTMLAQLSVVAAESRNYAHRTRHIVCLRQRAGSCVTASKAIGRSRSQGCLTSGFYLLYLFPGT
jgi:hypothetical protein